MIRRALVDECLSCAREALPSGPWCFVVIDRACSVVDEQVFSPDEEIKARRWMLEHVQRSDRAVAFRPWLSFILSGSGGR